MLGQQILQADNHASSTRYISLNHPLVSFPGELSQEEHQDSSKKI